MVLAKRAGQITARRPKTQHWRAWQKMVERFFLNRVDAEAAGPAIGGEHNLVALPTAHKAQPSLAIAELTKTRTNVALDTPVFDRMPVSS